MVKVYRTLGEDQIDQISTMHSISFYKGPMFKLLFNSNIKDIKWATKLRAYSMREKYYTLIIEDVGFSCWIEPNKPRVSSVLKQILAGYWKSPFKLGFKAFSKMLKFGAHEKKMMSQFDPDAYIFDMLAVVPEHQGKGYSKLLIEPVLEKAAHEKKDIYFYTQDPSNVSYYKKLGFSFIEEHEVAYGISAYVFKKKNS